MSQGGRARLVLDDRFDAVLARLEDEDARRARARCRAAAAFPAGGAARPGSSSSRSSRRRPRRGSRDRRLARLLRRSGSRPARASSAGASSSLESDPAKCAAWRRNIAEAGARTSRPSSSKATPSRPCRALEDVFDVVFLDAEKDDYEELFELARDKVEPGALVVADNVLSQPRQLAATPPHARPTRRSSRSRFRSIAGWSSRQCSAPSDLAHRGP